MADLERQLRQLGGEIAYPQTPDIAAAITARLDAGRQPLLERRRTLALGLAVAAVAIGAAVIAVPQARTAILDWLGVGGVEIRLVDELPEVPAGAAVPFGESTTLEQVGGQAGYRVLAPGLEGLERPNSVLLSQFAPGRPVTFVYGRGGRIRLLMTQFRGEPLIEKSLVMARKGVEAGTNVEQVTVNGGRGLWLSGEPHSFVFLDRRGEAYQESLRLARNTLLWEQSGLTVRLEGDLTKEQALEIARSVR